MIRAEPIMRQALLEAGRAAAKARRVPLRAISRLTYGDSGFFERLRLGNGFTVAKYDQAMQWFADPKNWPDGNVPLAVRDLFANSK